MILDFIGLFILLAGFIIGLGAVTVIDIHGFLEGNFLVFAHASPRACPRRIGSLHHAIGAYEAVSSHHALRACDYLTLFWK